MARMNVSPYYDTSSEEYAKNYIQLLAVPGRVAQARELTASQGILRDIIKSVGDSVMTDGDIIEGCQVIVNTEKTAVTVTAGRIYIDGMTVRLASTTVPITGSGTEVIGVKIQETVIDETEDSTLRDPAQGYDSYNLPGCHRLRRTLQVVVNDSDSAIIATLVNGDLMVDTYAPEYDVLNQTLARRTYDESGSYIVEGLTVRVEPAASNTDYVVTVESGKAYILGYELRIPTARRITVPRSTTYGSVVASNYTYEDTQTDYLLDDNQYVRDISSVVGIVSHTEGQSLTTNADRIQLTQQSVINVINVTQGGTTYVQGTDYELTRDGNYYYIQWLGTSNYPAAGSSYSVVYRYNKVFTLTTDYLLATINNRAYLSWVNGGSTPIDGTNFTVTYNQYLARKDIVYIDRYGDIAVKTGNPSDYGYESIPDAPLNTLSLAVVMNPPNGQVTNNDPALLISVSNIGLTRFTMNDIQGLLNRVRKLEYDQAVLTLNDDAQRVYTVNDKKGVLTDPFIDLSRIDFYYNLDSTGQVADSTLPTFEMAFDFLNNMCYLPITSNIYDTTLHSSSTTHRYNRLLSLGVTGESIALEQLNATKVFLVNPYSVFPQLPEISITPAVDNWIEDTLIEVPVSLTDSTIISTSSSVIDRYDRQGIRRASTQKESSTISQVGTLVTTTTNESIIDEQAILYIRQRTISVAGTDFLENLDNIEGYFDGQKVTLTPTDGTLAGTSAAGSVKADASGSFKCTFTIPANVRTGTREVLLKSAAEVDGYQNFARADYQASGTRRTIERTVTTLTTVLLHRTTTVTVTHHIDPLGQTFVLDHTALLKGIDLYFENVADDAPIVVEIRGVTDGQINSTVYAHKSLAPSSVNASATASVATRFTFDDPVFLEQGIEYAFVVRSSSDRYRIWVAELGGTDVRTGEQVLRNAYLSGLMFSSSNNSSWTPHQTTDMKFRLMEDTYDTSSTAYFTQLTGLSAARLYLTADAAIPNGTSVEWSYSTDGGLSYKSITPYDTELLGAIKTQVNLRAVMSRRLTTQLSPLIALDTVSLAASKWKTSGTYITKNVTQLDAYTSVKIIADVYIPGGTSLTFYASNDNGATLVAATLDANETRNLSNGWKEQVYNVTFSSATQCRIIVKAASTNEYTTPVMQRLRAIMS